jgi:L-arabinokinase
MKQYEIISGSAQGLRDTIDFIGSIDRSIASLPGDWRAIFDSEKELIVTRAPGRLDLMGGIADYSGSLVLQWPIQAAVHVALQRNESHKLRIASLPDDVRSSARLFEMELEEIRHLGAISNYESACTRFAAQTESHWAGYVAGALLVLMREKEFSFDDGISILIESNVPEGKGVSSSAALEVASMQALAAAYEIEICARELALLCQRVENHVVGAPCGVMDQMTASSGEANHLLELLCQPADLKGLVALPEELEVWGIDSGIRHSIAGSDYRTVRTAAFMGYRIIADAAGLEVRQDESPGHVRIDDPKWKGYLANITPEEFETDYAAIIPTRLSGEDFLKRFEGITDRVTAVEASRDYPVLAATRHPIYENARVKSFAQKLRGPRTVDDIRCLGDLMYQSHESYTQCGLGSDGTDKIVELVHRSAGEDLYGAKITGGGSGGTVAVLGRRGAGEAIEAVVAGYREQSGYQPEVISGSSPGAHSFGHLRLSKTKSNGANLQN